MTIIGLVAVVLVILGLFLFQYIDTSFPKENDQRDSLLRLTQKIAGEVALHQLDAWPDSGSAAAGTDESAYVTLTNDFLRTQDAALLMTPLDRAAGAAALLFGGVGIGTLDQALGAADMQQLAAGNTLIHAFKGTDGNDYLLAAAPVQKTGKPVSEAAVVYQSKKSVENMQTYIKKLFAFVSFIGFILTTFLAFFLITRITRPLVRLRNTADLIAHGQYGNRVPVVSSDEIGELAVTFNRMGERLDETIKALHYEKENLGSVLHSMADAVISFDAEGGVIFTNPHGEELLEAWNRIGWDEQEGHDNSLPDLAGSDMEGYRGNGLDARMLVPKRLVPQPLRHLFGEVAKEARQVTTKLHVQSGVWSVVMAPLYSRDQVRGAVAVLRDVTEEHRLDKLRKDFVANVSHELRTPLSMLQGYSEALVDDIAATPEERQEMAQVIHDESLRMGRLVKDLLDLARMEAGHLELSFEEVELTQLLKRVHRKFLALCKERGIRLELELGGAPLALASADEDRLEQVLTNLLDNAIRHTPEHAGIALRGWTEGDDVLLEIADEGSGIPPEDLPYIFERFYKADKARTRGSSGGTGLGLAIVRNLIDAHRGTIRAQSALGKGTTFTISLPRGAAPSRK
ncbi:MAG: HAMP domain-containing protein [Paenibacillaceae bacterium]|nr:HAMP domain-containing protein [Paenibacillaceae bacterium]